MPYHSHCGAKPSQRPLPWAKGRAQRLLNLHKHLRLRHPQGERKGSKKFPPIFQVYWGGGGGPNPQTPLPPLIKWKSGAGAQTHGRDCTESDVRNMSVPPLPLSAREVSEKRRG